MALINYDKKEEKKLQPVAPVIEPINHKSTLIDTEFVPRSNIITQISGSPWKVDYYSQVLNDDSALNGHNPSKDALTQAYIKISELVLRVTSPLSTSQDNKSNAMNVVGTASVYPNIYPNQGDMFVANIGDGRLAIFRVTTIEEKSIFKDTSWVIDYTLIAYADGTNGSLRYKDLEDKVIQTKHFVLEFMDYNQNPLVTSDEYNTYKELRVAYSEIADNYYRLFASAKLKALLVPKQQAITYDPFLTSFMVKAFDGNITPRANLIKTFNVADRPVMKLPTLWDALLNRDTDIMNYITTMMYITPVNAFTMNPVYEGIYYSGVKEVVYPANPILDTDTQIELDSGDCTCTDVAAVRFQFSKDTKAISSLNGTPLNHRSNSDGYYILTKHFYQRTAQMSLLEAQVWNYLENKPVDQDIIHALVKDYHSWGSLEKFYYLPILLLLIQSIVRGL